MELDKGSGTWLPSTEFMSSFRIFLSLFNQQCWLIFSSSSFSISFTLTWESINFHPHLRADELESLKESPPWPSSEISGKLPVVIASVEKLSVREPRTQIGREGVVVRG